MSDFVWITRDLLMFDFPVVGVRLIGWVLLLRLLHKAGTWLHILEAGVVRLIDRWERAEIRLLISGS